jgi:hypothetical protein
VLELHEKLYELAKLDLKAANILRDNNMFSHAIYEYAQSFEKSTKSILAKYFVSYEKMGEQEVEQKMKKSYGHKLIQVTIAMIKILIADDTRLYISRGGNETDDFIQNPLKAIQGLEQHKYSEEELIVHFSDIVSHNFKAYLKTKNKQFDGYEHPGWEYLRQQFADAKTTYLRYNTISWILAPVLEDMERYVRYPSKSVNYNNTRFLMDHKNKKPCEMLDEMISELIDTVPLVWDKIISMT